MRLLIPIVMILLAQAVFCQPVPNPITSGKKEIWVVPGPKTPVHLRKISREIENIILGEAAALGRYRVKGINQIKKKLYKRRDGKQKKSKSRKILYDKKRLLKDTQYGTDWIHEVAKRIAGSV